MSTGTFTCKAVGITKVGEPLHRFDIARREPGADDVVIKIQYAGICHSDIHTVLQEWGPTPTPLVVGHEIIGIVERVGAEASDFKVGDRVGVGCFVDSCRNCGSCKKSLGQYCDTGAVFTYNSKFKYPHCREYTPEGGNNALGGYSQYIVCQKDYVLRVPTNLDPAAATPLLCAGITVYSPMKQFGVKAGDKLAVAGLGGLGHCGVLFAKALGCHVTVVTRGEGKRASALAMGADEVIDSTNEEQMKANSSKFDFVLNTISAAHDINALGNLLTLDGTMIVVGAGPDPMTFRFGSLIGKRRRIVGSLIGGIAETQEMLDFCGKHNLVCQIELINADQVNEAYTRTLKSDVKYRFVIDVATI